MPKIRKRHSSDFKAKVALDAIKGQETLGELSQKYGIAPTQISTWKNQLEEASKTIFASKQENTNHQEEIDRLHRVIGQLTAERDFLDYALKH